jgi:hypothetical protein
MKYALVLAALAALPAAANAVVIDFDAAPQNTVIGPSYSEDGFTITGSGFVFPQFEGFAFSTYTNDGSIALNYKGPSYTLTMDGGGTFDFTSFQLGNVNGNMEGGTLQIAFDGGPATSLAIPTDSMLQTYTFDMMDVTSVVFSYLPTDTFLSLESYARIDNIVLNESAVPEPASWALMIAGFGLVGTGLRRRQRTVATA